MDSDSGSILLLGIHTRPAVKSSKNLGFHTLSVDYFGDVDLLETADLSRSIQHQQAFQSSGRISEQYSSQKLLDISRDLRADRILLTSTLDLKGHVIGNQPERVAQINDKEYQFKTAARAGMTVPEYEIVRDTQNAVEAAHNIGFPCILKPVRGAGGVRVVLAKDERDISGVDEPYIIQKFVKGTPISSSTLSTKNDSMLLSTSEQILGSIHAGQSGFGYCGSIVPCRGLKKQFLESMEEISIRLSKAFGVVGWNGIDFVHTSEPVFMEVNPRFQGTLECIESSYGINLIDAHIRACEGELIRGPAALKTTVRLTLYARERCIVLDDLRGYCVDVPLRYSIIEEGEPVTTIITAGRDRSLLNSGIDRAKEVYSSALLPCPP